MKINWITDEQYNAYSELYFFPVIRSLSNLNWWLLRRNPLRLQEAIRVIIVMLQDWHDSIDKTLVDNNKKRN